MPVPDLKQNNIVRTPVMTWGDHYAEVYGRGIRERWALAYQEALTMRKTADDKAKIRQDFIRALQSELAVYTEYRFKATESWEKARREGNEKAWLETNKAELENFKEDSTNRRLLFEEVGRNRRFNVDQENTTARSNANNLTQAGKLAGEASWEEEQARQKNLGDLWERAVARQGENGKADQWANAIDQGLGNKIAGSENIASAEASMLPGTPNPRTGIASSPEQISRTAAEFMADKEIREQVMAGNGAPFAMMVEGIFSQASGPENQAMLIDRTRTGLQAAGPEYVRAFNDALATKEYLLMTKKDFDAGRSQTAGLSSARKVGQQGMEDGTYANPTELDAGSEAMLEDIGPSQQAYEEQQAMLSIKDRRARDLMDRLSADQQRYLTTEMNDIDNARSIYSTRFLGRPATPPPSTRPMTARESFEALSPEQKMELKKKFQADRPAQTAATTPAEIPATERIGLGAPPPGYPGVVETFDFPARDGQPQRTARTAQGMAAKPPPARAPGPVAGTTGTIPGIPNLFPEGTPYVEPAPRSSLPIDAFVGPTQDPAQEGRSAGRKIPEPFVAPPYPEVPRELIDRPFAQQPVYDFRDPRQSIAAPLPPEAPFVAPPYPEVPRELIEAPFRYDEFGIPKQSETAIPASERQDPSIGIDGLPDQSVKLSPRDQMEKDDGAMSLAAIHGARELVKKPRQLERLLKTDPVAKNAASVFQINAGKPIKDSIATLKKGYSKDPQKAKRALEIFFALDLQHKQQAYIKKDVA